MQHRPEAALHGLVLQAASDPYPMNTPGSDVHVTGEAGLCRQLFWKQQVPLQGGFSRSQLVPTPRNEPLSTPHPAESTLFTQPKLEVQHAPLPQSAGRELQLVQSPW